MRAALRVCPTCLRVVRVCRPMITPIQVRRESGREILKFQFFSSRRSSISPALALLAAPQTSLAPAGCIMMMQQQSVSAYFPLETTERERAHTFGRMCFVPLIGRRRRRHSSSSSSCARPLACSLECVRVLVDGAATLLWLLANTGRRRERHYTTSLSVVSSDQHPAPARRYSQAPTSATRRKV